MPLPSSSAGSTVSARPSTCSEERASRRIVPDLTLREARLIPDAEKLRRADFSYVNDGTLAELDAFVAGVIATLSG